MQQTDCFAQRDWRTQCLRPERFELCSARNKSDAWTPSRSARIRSTCHPATLAIGQPSAARRLAFASASAALGSPSAQAISAAMSATHPGE